MINSIFKNNALYIRKQQEQEGNARPSLEASHLLLAINSDYSTLAYATLVQLGSTRHDLLACSDMRHRPLLRVLLLCYKSDVDAESMLIIFKVSPTGSSDILKENQRETLNQ